MPLRDIIGQDTALWCLRGLLKRNRPGNALLFHGPNGCGKRTAALAYAAALNCERTAEGDACGECGSCRRIGRGVDVDVQMFYPVKGEYTVDQVKEIRAQAFLTPNTGPWKALVLDEVDRLSRDSGNRLLKVIEEPPETTIFILLTSALDRVLSTIRSRALPVPFRPLSEDEVGRIGAGRLDAETAHFLYGVARGDAGAALALCEDEGLRKLFEETRELAREHLARRSMCSPTWLADRVTALGDRFPLVETVGAEAEESKASRSRRGAIAVLDVALTELRSEMLDAAKDEKRGEMFRMRDRMESVLETSRAIAGMGNQALALEGLALRMRELNQ